MITKFHPGYKKNINNENLEEKNNTIGSSEIYLIPFHNNNEWKETSDFDINLGNMKILAALEIRDNNRVDGTWQINRMNGETRQGGIKRSMHKLYRARFWCTRDDRLVSLFFATRFDPIDRYSHFLPCAASRTLVPRITLIPVGYVRGGAFSYPE